jgi:hypothetical protein
MAICRMGWHPYLLDLPYLFCGPASEGTIATDRPRLLSPRATGASWEPVLGGCGSPNHAGCLTLSVRAVRNATELHSVVHFILAPLLLTLTLATAWAQTSRGPESVVIRSGAATLHAMLWRPQGRGPFPAILLNHGSGRTSEEAAAPRTVRAECRDARSALR